MINIQCVLAIKVDYPQKDTNHTIDTKIKFEQNTIHKTSIINCLN